jgi:hypothetical protein
MSDMQQEISWKRHLQRKGIMAIVDVVDIDSEKTANWLQVHVE